MAWTKDQTTAIFDSGHNIIVSAGAGSGKTAVLSERVLEFVKQGYKLDEFLILTFTKLAAGEMKSRIRDKLTKNGLEEAKNVDTSDICNFDSYAFNIVKKYHFMLNLSSDVSIIDQNVMSVRKINIISDIFNRKYTEHDQMFEKMISQFCYRDDNELRKLVLKIHSLAELQLDKEQFLNDFMDKYYSNEFLKNSLNQAYEVIRYSSEVTNWIDSIELLPNVPYKKTDKLSIAEIEHNKIEGIHYCNDYESLIDFINNYKYGTKPRNTLDELEEKAFYDSKEYCDSVKKMVEGLPLSNQEFYDQVNNYKDYASVLIEIVKELDKKQYDYKIEKQAFEFQDIAKMALNLVKNNDEIRLSLKSQYKMIMIDEYQDTSALQESFINLIANNNVYMVGDIKQSIYAFRNARSDIFKDKYDNYKANRNGKAIDMNKNFRSREEVLADINIIFSKIMSDELGGADYLKSHVIEYGNLIFKENETEGQNNHSTCILYDREYLKKKDPDLEARIIANDIKEKINNQYQVMDWGQKPTKRDVKYSDFCILMDRGTQFDSIKKVFQEYQIPLFVEQDEDIKNNIIVLILTNLLLLIKAVINNDYNSKDLISAYLSIARSFIFSKTDKELFDVCSNKDFYNSDVITTIREVVNQYSYLSTYELLVKVIDELQIYNKLILIGNVAKNEMYLDEFLKYFKQMGDLNYSIDDFITYLENVNEYNLKISITSGSTSLDSVRIMNIHKSKGLEFPIVYFAGLNKAFNRMEAKEKYGISEKFGILLPVENKEYLLKKMDNIVNNKDDLSEKIRLLYVALTRAKEKMIFIMPEPNEKDVKPLEQVKSLYGFMCLFANVFEHYNYDVNKEIEKQEAVEVEKQEIKLKEVSFNNEIIESFHASKALKLGSNKKVLERGTMLHEIMEIVDFKSPDLSFIKNNSIKQTVTNFLNWDVNKNIKDGEVYKEYEFVNENYSGIIDLLVVYDDHIDIIDYKTKNIADEHYDDQLHVYKDFISKHFNQPIKMYLYSLSDSISREVL